MLIRTQDKRSLVDITNLVIRIDAKNDIIAYSTNSLNSFNYITLGEYSTEEKATKVLDMIQYRYEQYHRKYGEVFNMPADKDVEVEIV